MSEKVKKQEKEKRRGRKISKLVFKRLSTLFSRGRYLGKNLSPKDIVFAGVRPYIPKDPFNAIDWKTILRDRPLVKTKEKDNVLSAFFVVDVSPSIFFRNFSKLEALKSFFEIMACGVAGEGNSVGVYSFGGRKDLFYPILDGVSGVRHAWEEITKKIARDFDAVFSSKKHTDIDNLLKAIDLSLRDTSMIFLISDFSFPLEYSRDLENLVSRHDLIPVLIKDEMDDLSLSCRGAMLVKDMETGERKLVKRIKPEVSYKSVFQRLGLRILEIDTKDDEEKICREINKFFFARRQ